MDEYLEIENWFSTLPNWIQESMRYITDRKSLTNSDIDYLYDIFHKETIEEERLSVDNFKNGWLHSHDSAIRIKLISISNIKGVNKLNPKKPLVFGDSPITVVYGENGVGKSGYVRIIKKIKNSDSSLNILSNVFESRPPKQQCDISLMVDSSLKEFKSIDLGEGSDIDEFKSIDIFDSDISYTYICDKKVYAYEPKILIDLSRLAELFTNFISRIDSEISCINIVKIPIPNELINSDLIKYYSDLSFKTDIQCIINLSTWSESNENEQQLLFSILNEKDPEKQIEKLNKLIECHDKLLNLLKEAQESVSINSQDRIITASINYKEKKNILSEATKILNEETNFSISSATWRALWESAKIYSEQIAYPNIPFPYLMEDAKCPLCQQELSSESISRFTKMESFVNGKLSQDERSSYLHLKNEIDTIVKEFSIELLTSYCETCDISSDIQRELINFIISINSFAQTINKAIILDEHNDFADISLYLDIINKSKSSILINVNSLHDLINTNKKAVLTKQYYDLKCKKWFSDNLTFIVNEYNMLKYKHTLENARNTIQTKTITDKTKVLSKELISKSYIENFNNELKALGIRGLSIKFKTSGSSGKLFNNLILYEGSFEYNKPNLILSEGESRIISLAAFLADTQGRSILSPFVFDDPISSLDIRYEQAVIKRLIELSSKRQVIIFTHRLSLYRGLLDMASRKGIQLNSIELCKQPWGAGEIREASFFSKSVKSRLNTLKDSWILEAKKLFVTSGYSEEYYSKMKSICSEIRIGIEDSISDVLLNGIVKRFDPAIHTNNNLKCLSDITLTDCETLDNLMDKYCFTEHSQSDERGKINFDIEDPRFSIPEIINDLTSLLKLIESISKRRK